MNIIVVNRHKVLYNRKNGTREPVLRHSKGKYGKPVYSNEIIFEGKGRVIYNPDKPLPCGATCWIEIA